MVNHGWPWLTVLQPWLKPCFLPWLVNHGQPWSTMVDHGEIADWPWLTMLGYNKHDQPWSVSHQAQSTMVINARHWPWLKKAWLTMVSQSPSTVNHGQQCWSLTMVGESMVKHGQPWFTMVAKKALSTMVDHGWQKALSTMVDHGHSLSNLH